MQECVTETSVFLGFDHDLEFAPSVDCGDLVTGSVRQRRGYGVCLHIEERHSQADVSLEAIIEAGFLNKVGAQDTFSATERCDKGSPLRFL